VDSQNNTAFSAKESTSLFAVKLRFHNVLNNSDRFLEGGFFMLQKFLTQSSQKLF